jgi:transposase
MLESARKVTKPRDVDLYDVFCAVQYVLREGCRWRSLPHDFPKWQNVYAYFRIWSEEDENGRSLLDRVLKNLSGYTVNRIADYPKHQ